MRVLLLFLGLFPFSLSGQTNYASHVNPMIGTGGHGHTFPGATVPFGMVQLSPDTRIDGSWDGCSGYHYSDESIYGFSHTHLSGTGCSDYGDIALLPLTGKEYEKFYLSKSPVTLPGSEWLGKKEKFSHAAEVAQAGFYSVMLDNKVKVELTTTTRAGFHQYSFPANAPRILVIKIDHRDKTLLSKMLLKGNKTISGQRTSEAWARQQEIFYTIDFSEEFVVTEYTASTTKASGDTLVGAGYIVLKFKKNKSPQKLKIKVGISTVSIEGARKNLDAEIPHWDFERTKAEAKSAWNKELSKIEVNSTEKDQLSIFYTALYHAMIHPSTASDVDGQYRGRDNKIHKAEGYTYYTVFSLWDTFRALHPLMALIDEKRTTDFIKTFLAQYQQAHLLPVWELSSNETWCMIGYHSVSVMADAYAKGIRNFDTKLALEAMKKSSDLNYFGIDLFGKKGYLEKEDEHESVSKTLEYAYDDWCIATFAQSLGNKETAGEYYKRGLSWRNMFDKNTGFIRPRSNGGWMEPFDPREVNNNYTEANGWQYTFFVPHDIDGLMNMYGSSQKFAEKLDALFTADSKTTGREQSDITGLIGQYAHGNEPSHHMVYLYNYAGQPWKTQKLIHQIQTEFYKNTPDGLIGNEDCGQMSAWYVFSAMGFYPVCPGSTQYALGTPAFPKVVLHLENGKDFTIETENWNHSNFYLKDLSKLYITHEEILNGNTLKLNMSDQAQDNPKNYPVESWPSTKVDRTYMAAPVFGNPQKTFHDSLRVFIEPMLTNTGAQLFYTYDNPYCGPLDTCQFERIKYTGPFYIHQSSRVWTFQQNEKKGERSAVSEAYYHKIPHNWTINITGKYNPQYTAGGDEGIIDGLYADENWRKGGWQGYQSQDFEAVVDLQKEMDVNRIETGFLQDQRAWIFMPKNVEYFLSLDGKNWEPFAAALNPVDPKDEKVQIHRFVVSSVVPVKARYVKVKAVNFGKLPEWHQGYGMGDAFIFVDEITVK